MHTWILLLALGCGTSDDGGDTGSATGTSSTTTESSTTTSGTPTPSTWECNEWYPCQDCGGVSCGAEIGACAGDGACGAALNAWAACVLDCGYPAACAQEFVDAGGSAAGALYECTVAGCADECDL